MGPSTVMPSWPMRTPARSVAVTLPSAKPATFRGPIPNPTRQRQEHGELGMGPQRVRRTRSRVQGAWTSSRVRTCRSISWIFFGSDVWVRASFSSTRALDGLSSIDATVPTLSSVDLDVAAHDAFADARRPHDDDALGDGALDGLERRRRHVAVADAGDDEALGAVGDRGVDEVGRHPRVRVDHVDARQDLAFLHRERRRRRVRAGRRSR